MDARLTVRAGGSSLLLTVTDSPATSPMQIPPLHTNSVFFSCNCQVPIRVVSGLKGRSVNADGCGSVGNTVVILPPLSNQTCDRSHAAAQQGHQKTVLFYFVFLKRLVFRVCLDGLRHLVNDNISYYLYLTHEKNIACRIRRRKPCIYLGC